MGCEKKVQRELDELFLEVSTELAKDELGNRRRALWYRNKYKRADQNLDFGKPGSPDRPWTKISPTPAAAEMTEGPDGFTVDQVGLIVRGDIEVVIDRLSVRREVLEVAEFYMSDDSDAPDPLTDTLPNYDLINGSVLSGGAGVRGRNKSFWIVYLRKKQAKFDLNRAQNYE
jgi:hypothetical protein